MTDANDTLKTDEAFADSVTGEASTDGAMKEASADDATENASADDAMGEEFTDGARDEAVTEDSMGENSDVDAANDPLADVAASEDNLYQDGYVKGTADFIKTCATPMTIAIQGKWGAGKTSLINLIKAELRATTKSEEYEDSDVKKYCEDIINTTTLDVYQDSVANPDADPYVSLLGNVITKLSGSNLTELDKVSKFATLASQVIGVVIQNQENPEGGEGEEGVSLGSIIGSVFGGEEESNEEQENTPTSAEDIEALKNAFLDALSQSAKANGKSEDSRLVIFLDGLDHIEPENVIDLLEKIKTHMECARCVFVLALDEVVIFDGMRSKLGDNVDEGRRKMFFEKFVQVPHYIPASSRNLDKYFKHLLKDGKERSSEFVKVVDTLLDGPTPRSIKRYVNTMYEDLSSLEESKNAGSGSLAMLFAAVILKIENGQGFDAIANCDQDDEAHFDENLKSTLESLGHDGGINWDMLPALWGDEEGANVDAGKKNDFLSWVQKLK